MAVARRVAAEVVPLLPSDGEGRGSFASASSSPGVTPKVGFDNGGGDQASSGCSGVNSTLQLLGQ